MAFKKGMKKVGGRKVGAKNKFTSVRELIQEALERNAEHVNKILDDWCKDPAKLDYVLNLKANFEPKSMPVAGGAVPDGSYFAQVTPINLEERIKTIVEARK